MARREIDNNVENIREKGVILQGSVVGSKEKCSSKFEEAKVWHEFLYVSLYVNQHAIKIYKVAFYMSRVSTL